MCTWKFICTRNLPQVQYYEEQLSPTLCWTSPPTDCISWQWPRVNWHPGYWNSCRCQKARQSEWKRNYYLNILFLCFLQSRDGILRMIVAGKCNWMKQEWISNVLYCRKWYGAWYTKLFYQKLTMTLLFLTAVLHGAIIISCLFTIISISISGGARALKLGGTISCRRREVSRGVRGHAPPGKFCNRESLKRNGFSG